MRGANSCYNRTMAERDPTPALVVDAATAALAQQLATALNTTLADAVRIAVEEKLKNAPSGINRRPAREILREYWASHALPPQTGLKADKAFFDALSGDL